MACALSRQAHASDAPFKAYSRIISINMCTDQLLLDLARPQQIAGLSPFARDSRLSWLAGKAAGLPILSGTAEEVMLLKPDVVMADRYTKSVTRQFIAARAIPMEEFEPVVSIAETREQILRAGRLVGATGKAARRVEEIDAALTQLRSLTSRSRLRILPLARRGWVSGSQSLISGLLSEAGVINAADELGFRSGGFATLEAVVKLRPDAILLTGHDHLAEDQGSAMLLHPAIEALFPPERRIVVPQTLTICGGPMLAEAMNVLAGQISRIKPR